MNRWKVFAAAVLLPLLLHPLAAQNTALSAERLLARAQHKAYVERDLKAAIEDYKAAVAAAGTNRALAARVLIELAECYVKLGDVEAQKIYTRVLRDYADQKEAAAVARTRIVTRETRSGALERAAWSCQDGEPGSTSVLDLAGDGQQLALTKQGDLVIRDLSSCADRVLVKQERRGTTLVAYPVSAVFSRDGRQVAYNWRRIDALPIVDELRVVSVAVGDYTPRVLIKDEQTSGYGVRPFDWSPDGRRIFVSIGHLEDGVRQIGYVDVDSTIFRVLRSLEWRGPTRLAVSPDGKHVAYDVPASEQQTQRDVLMLATDGSNQIVVADHRANEELIGWSADGHVLFVSDRFGARDLWSQAVKDGKRHGDPVPLRSNLPGAIVDLTSTGDLLMRVETGGYTLHTTRIDFAAGQAVAGPASIALTPTGLNPPADWSPDLKSIAYLSAAADGATVMAIQTLETGQTRTVPLRVAAILAYRWTPDGRAFIAQAADFKNRVGIVRIDAATGDVAPIAMPPAPTRYTRPQLSADGSKLYYFANVERVLDGRVVRDPSLVERDMSTGSERTLMKLSGRPSAAFGNLSPDGRYLGAVLLDKPRMAVSIIDLSTGVEQELLRVSAPENFLGGPPVEWTPDSRAVVVRKEVGEKKQEIWLIPMDRGQPRRLDLGVSNYSGFQIRISPDGRQIAFTTGDQPSREFRVLERIVLPSVARK
jgi:Tol biopolymer transport system component